MRFIGTTIYFDSVYTTLCSPPEVLFPFDTIQLTTFTHFALPLGPFPSGNHYSVLCIFESVSVFLYPFDLLSRFHISVILYSICLLLTYITKHNILKVHSHCCRWQNFILFYVWVILHCVCVCVYPGLFFNDAVKLYHQPLVAYVYVVSQCCSPQYPKV